MWWLGVRSWKALKMMKHPKQRPPSKQMISVIHWAYLISTKMMQAAKTTNKVIIMKLSPRFQVKFFRTF